MDCPLCHTDVSLIGEELESHLRKDLDYFPWRCRICKAEFSSFSTLQRHFQGEFSPHPNTKPKFTEKIQADKDKMLTNVLEQLNSYHSQSAVPDPVNHGSDPEKQQNTHPSKSQVLETPKSIQEQMNDATDLSALDCSESMVDDSSVWRDALEPADEYVSSSPMAADKCSAAPVASADPAESPVPQFTEPLNSIIFNGKRPMIIMKLRACDREVKLKVGHVKCQLCFKPFSWEKRESHVFVHHLDDPLSCFCGENVRHLPALYEHARSTMHMDTTTLNTHIKNIRDSMKGQLDRLYELCLGNQDSTNVGKILCRLCNQEYKRYHREEHMFVNHFLDPPFVCICGVTFRRRATFRGHLARHEHMPIAASNHQARIARTQLRDQLRRLYDICEGRVSDSEIQKTFENDSMLVKTVKEEDSMSALKEEDTKSVLKAEPICVRKQELD